MTARPIQRGALPGAPLEPGGINVPFSIRISRARIRRSDPELSDLELPGSKQPPALHRARRKKMNQTLAVTKVEAVEDIGPRILEVRVVLEDASTATLRMNGP